MKCEKSGCKHSAYRASGYCLVHLNESLADRQETKCRNQSCSNVAEYFGLCCHCNAIYQQGKAEARKRSGVAA